MKNYYRIIILSVFSLFLITSFGCKPKSSSGSKTKKDIAFLKSAHWNKGMAEYQTYNYKLGWYKTPRETNSSIMVLVKEGWDAKKNVKSDKHANSSVLKYSIFDIFETGTYPYSFKADMFFDTDNGEIVKYVMGAHDGCGNHFFRYDKRGNRGIFTWHSYWNDHGLIVVTKPTSSFDTFFDALPTYLRFRLTESSYKIKVVQPLVANRPIDITKPMPHLANQKDAVKRGVPHIVEASVTNTKDQTINGRKAIKTDVVHGSKTDTYYFTSEFPHTLIQWKGSGQKNLKYSNFFKYWVPANRGKPAGQLPNPGSSETAPTKKSENEKKSK